MSLTTTEKVLTILCSLIALLTVIEFLEKVSHVLRQYKTSKSIKYKTIHILGIYPAVSVACLASLYIPRANILCQLMSSVYISRCMYIFITLMIQYFGGSEKMMSQLRHDRIILRSPPCCCCCCCLPTFAVTMKNVCTVKVLVLQNAFLQPILTFVTIILWNDGKYTDGQFSLNNSFPYLNVISTVSTLLGLYGYMMFYNLCKDHLKAVFIKPKFLSLQLVIIFRQLQGAVFSVLAKFGIPPCIGTISSNIRGQAYLQMVLVLQMFLLSLLARYVYYRPQDTLSSLPCDEDMQESQHMTCCTASKTDSDMPVWTESIQTKEPTPNKDKMKDSSYISDQTWLNYLDKCSESTI